MKTLLPTEARNRWKHVLKEVAEGEEITIHLKKDQSIIMMASDLYDSLLATIDTLSDPDAMRAIRRHRERKGRRYSLRDIDRLIA